MFLYNVLIYLLEKLIYISSFFNKKAALWIEGRRKFPEFIFKEKTIWMHCASLGEFEQGRSVIEKLKTLYPHYPVIISFFSPSGYEVRKNYSGADKVIYLPLDTMENAKKIIDQINPALVIWVKYEYWMNCLLELKRRKVPVLLIAGIFRNSQPFFKWYGSLWKKTLAAFEHLFVQNEESVILLQQIDIKNVSVSGDTRFDRVIEIAENTVNISAIEKFKEKNLLIVAGSTWDKDEELLATFSNVNPDIKLIIVPHEIHTSNLNRIKNTFNKSVLYSEWTKQVNNTLDVNVLIVDSIGLLSTLYRYADITYIGGGFHKGIHNTLEAAVYGKPVVFGPRFQKFAEAKKMIENEAAFSISSSEELISILTTLFSNNEILNNAGLKAKEYVYANKGATESIINYVKLNRLLTN